MLNGIISVYYIIDRDGSFDNRSVPFSGEEVRQLFLFM